MGHASDVYTSFAGDLLLVVKVKKHEFFQRVGPKDIETEVPLNLVEALKGAKITV
jgi:DnaJ-class molecular chaperone